MTEIDTTASDPIPVVVVGCGRMGKLHAKTYSQMPGVKLVGVFDADAETAAAVAGEYRCQPFTKLEELLPLVKAVTIATPTRFHAAVAEPCLKSGVACLIEKPLARDVAESEMIAGWAEEYGVPVQVGHVERFNPVTRAMLALDLRPRFLEVVRISPCTFRSLDVGVVLDMMIHDLDLVLKLAASPVARVEASGVSVTGGTEDACNARLTFENGCVANVTASRLALKTERKLRAYSPDSFVSVDFGQRTGVIVRASDNLAPVRDAAAKVRSGEIKDPGQLKYTDMVRVEPLVVEPGDALRAQAESFIAAVRDKRRTEVTARDGLEAVQLAERIVAAIPLAGAM